MFVSFEHTAIASPNPPRLAQWYVDHLGFVINYRSERTCFVKAPNGSMIEIITAEGERAAETMKQPGIRHIAIAVDNFDADYARLKEMGVRFQSEPVSSKGNTVVFFYDGDGNLLHLIQREKPLD